MSNDVYEVWGYEGSVSDSGDYLESFYYQNVSLSPEQADYLERLLGEVTLGEFEGDGFFVIESAVDKRTIGDINDSDLDIFYEKCIQQGRQINLSDLGVL